MLLSTAPAATAAIAAVVFPAKHNAPTDNGDEEHKHGGNGKKMAQVSPLNAHEVPNHAPNAA
ncbi:hypothetical protein, partial [Streptomyces scabiei]|uniref:hypothetical protein n=1 Tax=Streptomyces scabiei TaxID=1930 RepID=UPI0029A20E45